MMNGLVIGIAVLLAIQLPLGILVGKALKRRMQ